MRTSIRGKILKLVLGVSLTVSLCISTVTLVRMRGMRVSLLKSNQKLAETVETYGKADLEAATMEGMRRLVDGTSRRMYDAQSHMEEEEILDWYKMEIKYLSYGGGGWGFLVDEKNKVIIAPDQTGDMGYSDQLQDVVLKDSADEGIRSFGEFLETDAENSPQGTGVRQITLNGREVYVGYTRAMEDMWLCSVIDVEVALEDAIALAKDIRLQSEMTVADMNDGIYQTYLVVIILLLFSICLIVIASFTFSKRMTRPLQVLTYHIRGLGEGKLDEKIDLSTGDEVEELSNAFNKMTEDLYQYIDNLAAAKAHNQEIIHLMDLQHGYYEQFLGQLDVTRRLLHDYNQFRRLMYGAIRENSLEKARNLLEQGDDLYQDMHLQMFCENMEVNAIVSYAVGNCMKQGVEFDHKINLPECVEGISIYDLCIIIGNLLDNAIEAAALCREGNKWVKLYATIHEANLMIRTENAYTGTINKVDGRMMTSKHDVEGHGLGISIVEKILKRYEGEISLEHDESQFIAAVLLPYRVIGQPSGKESQSLDNNH